MSENWSDRERQTNHLVRAAATWLFAQKEITPDQLFGLFKLTWITTGRVNADTYIGSVKIPALSQIFGQDYSELTLEQVAIDVSARLGVVEAEALVLNNTGFTNIYNAFRNSSSLWVKENFYQLLSMTKAAYELESDNGGRLLAEKLDRLSFISKSGNKAIAMHPANLLTPVFFALDKRIRFPIINGREKIKKLLARRGVRGSGLAEKYDAMIEMYGSGGIRDAADLDQISDELEHFASVHGELATKRLLQRRQENGKLLPSKDESDLLIVQEERTEVRKQLHNEMTNRLMDLWKDYTLTEGDAANAQYDVMVENYNGKGRDLIVEVKSSAEIANLRMAVGQLFSYWFGLDPSEEFHLCVLLPAKPALHDVRWLEWLKIGVIWFSMDNLETNCDWLVHLTSVKS